MLEWCKRMSKRFEFGGEGNMKVDLTAGIILMLITWTIFDGPSYMFF